MPLIFNVCYLFFGLMVLGALENSLVLFDKDEPNIILLLLFLVANLCILYVFHRNFLYNQYGLGYQRKMKLTSKTSYTLVTCSILMIVV
jgi:hypothetical protein